MNILLSVPFLVFLPLVVSILIISPLFTSNEVVLRRFAKSVFGLHFLYTVLMLVFFNPANPYFVNISLFGMDWIQSLGIKFGFKTNIYNAVIFR